ncbi:MAG: hypothetical protein R2762_17260 [Bryobacteraceae bacterium]
MTWEHGHPDEDAVEQYSLGTMPDDEQALFEEHMLLCELCQKRVEETDNYVRALRTAATRIQHAGAAQPKPKVVPRIRSFFPVPAASALAAAVLAIAVFAPRPEPVAGTAAVHLTALRGSSAAAGRLGTAPAHRQIEMTLDAAALPVRDSYVIELVDSTGKLLWQVPSKPAGDTLAVTYPAGCAPGQYWVRVYDSGRSLLREYGLQVR